MNSSSQRPRHGGNLLWAAQVAGCAPEQLLDLSASINPLGPPKSVLSAIQGAMGALRHYPDPDYRHLTQTLSQYHGVPQSWILPGNGVAELLTWVGRELAGLDQVHLLSPGFGDYHRALSAFEASVQCFELDLEACLIVPALDVQPFDCVGGLPQQHWIPTADQRIGCILNDPHNPTGQRLDPDWVLQCLRHFEWVVMDEAFLDFLPPDAQHSWLPYLAQFPNLVILRSLTKFYSIPGLRLGYAIAHPDHIARWKKWRDPWSVNVLALAAAEAALADVAFQHRTWAWLPEARQHLSEGLAAFASLTPLPSCVNFLLVHYDGNVPELQLKLLQQSQILIRDCLSFEGLGEHYFRVAVFQISDNEKLLSALKAILGG